MATVSGLRIGDADREAVAAALREHFALGRLTLEEFQHRLGPVFAAKTDRDLADVTSDLPHSVTPPVRPSLGPARQDAPRGQRRRSGLAAVTGLIVIILALILVAFILPVALVGSVISRSLLFILGVLLFGRRGLLRRFRRWLPGLRRRWPF